MIRPVTIGKLWLVAIWAESLLPLPAANLLQVQSVTVGSKTLHPNSGGELNIGASDRDLTFHFIVASNASWSPTRLRYKLEGFDTGWSEGGAWMGTTIRFTGSNGERVSQVAFTAAGNSAGWNGTLETSPFTHRRETLTVPRRATQAQVVISSAGPPDSVGIYVVDDLVLSRVSPTNSRPEVLLRSPFNRNSPLAVREGEPTGWMRDGIRPDMAKIIEVGRDPKAKAFAILDDDPNGHAEWRNRGGTPLVNPRDSLVLEWNEAYSMGTGIIRSARYGALKPGHYQFRVQDETILGTLTGVEASLAIYVPPPLWERPWFLTVMVIVSIAGSSAGIRYFAWRRMTRSMLVLQQQRALEQERLRIARDIHDDLGARVTQISLVSGVAQANSAFSPKARGEFERISRMCRELVSALYETVWAVNPENDNLDAMGTFLCQKINEFCAQAQLKCRLHVAELPENVPISSQARHNVSMAVKEAVHNVVKHAGVSLVTMRVNFVDTVLTVSVEDDGYGFNCGDSPSGYGLTNMKRRMEDIGGTCRIESLPGKGTIVRL